VCAGRVKPPIASTSLLYVFALADWSFTPLWVFFFFFSNPLETVCGSYVPLYPVSVHTPFFKFGVFQSVLQSDPPSQNFPSLGSSFFSQQTGFFFGIFGSIRFPVRRDSFFESLFFPSPFPRRGNFPKGFSSLVFRRTKFLWFSDMLVPVQGQNCRADYCRPLPPQLFLKKKSAPISCSDLKG